MIDFDTPVHETRSRESGNWLLQPSLQLHIQIRFRILTSVTGVFRQIFWNPYSYTGRKETSNV